MVIVAFINNETISPFGGIVEPACGSERTSMEEFILSHAAEKSLIQPKIEVTVDGRCRYRQQLHRQHHKIEDFPLWKRNENEKSKS